jgi:hypothetical protein
MCTDCLDILEAALIIIVRHKYNVYILLINT